MGTRLIFLLGVLFFVSLVAAPPIQTNVNLERGLQVFTLPYDTVKVNVPFYSQVHVTNITTGKELLNTEYNCSLNLFNQSGAHLFSGNYSDDPNRVDEELFLSKGNFSSLGVRAFRISCLSGVFGGEVTGVFEVTYTGGILSEGQGVLYAVFFSMLVLLFITNLVSIGMLPSRNSQDEEGKIMSISYLKYFRNVLMMTAYFLLIAISYISSSIAFAYLGEVLMAKTLFMIFSTLLAFAAPVVVIWVVYIFASMFDDKRFQQMLNRGIFPQGKL